MNTRHVCYACHEQQKECCHAVMLSTGTRAVMHSKRVSPCFHALHWPMCSMHRCRALFTPMLPGQQPGVRQANLTALYVEEASCPCMYKTHADVSESILQR
uniref:Uncharacterized protein n=1 Tax=Chlamydomonas euryale TaxID=1486919 RepID=A0A7R9V745_9CHLO